MNDESWDEEVDEAKLHAMERAAETAEPDYYRLLNVSRQASADDVRDAYRRLSRLFHPDRHRSAEQREWAQRQFHSVSRAYEVLTDARARAAYDQLGEKGVQTATALGLKVQSPRDLLEAFEREARRRRFEEIEQWTQSESTVTVSLDSTRLTADPLPRRLRSYRTMLGPVGLQSLFVRQAFSADLSARLRATVAGQAMSRDGRGSGNVLGTLTYTPGPHTWASASISALPPHRLTLQGSFQQSLERFYTTEVVQHSLDLSTPPSVTATAGRLLFGGTVGTLTVRTGNQYALGPLWARSPTRTSTSATATAAARPPARKVPRASSSVVLGLSGACSERGKFALEVTAGIEHSLASATYLHEVDSHFSVSGGVTAVGVGAPMPRDARFRIGDDDSVATAPNVASGLQGLGDVLLHAEMVATADSWTKLGWRVEFSLASGVQVAATLHYLGHRIQLPVLLTPLPDPTVAVLAALLPTVAALGLHYAVLRPRRRRIVQQRLDELREEQRALLYQRKRHAQEAVQLMAPAVERGRSAARAAGGLVIECALYGDLPFDIAAQNSNTLQAALDRFWSSRAALSAADEPRAADVTLALQALVTGDQLVIVSGGSKHSLPGFYDPIFGAPKRLFVRYRFRGVVHEALVADDEALAIPMRAHAAGPSLQST